MKNILSKSRVIPIVTLQDATDAVSIANALLKGGLSVVEITLRHDAAWRAVESICKQVPQMTVGVGTVTDKAQLQRAKDLGAQFAVSPGLYEDCVKKAQEINLPFLPGVITPTEVIKGISLGLDIFKFFPAELFGGIAMLQTYAGLFPKLKFCPTGGIDAVKASAYLKLANVVAVGGSWFTVSELLQAKDWAKISQLSSEACKF